ncbi:MAG: collagen-like protein [Bacteroidota bacterium]
MNMLTKVSPLAALFFIFSCSGNEGPEGPPGPEGPAGPQGAPGESGFVIEFADIDFVGPDYEVFLPFGEFEVLDTDAVFVYLLWDVVQVEGVDTDVWRLLPQTVLTDLGILQYNYDYTVVDTRLFLDAEFDLGTLEALDTQDWIARVVIVPANFVNGGRMASQPSYEELESLLQLPDLGIKHDKRR